MGNYTIFGAKVEPKLTNDDKNILSVSSKKELFFDVFECSFNGSNIVVEKIDEYEGKPLVRFEIKESDKVYNCEALLIIDEENNLFLNQNNLEFSKSIEAPLVEKTIVEEVKKIVPKDTIYEEKIKDLSEKIISESEEKAKLLNEAKIKEYELKQEQIKEQSEKYLNTKFKEYIKENIHDLVTDSNLVYDKLVENLNNLDDGEIKEILGERIKTINEELNVQLRNEVTSMKKYVEMNSGGGGTNAKQYANGGTMNGDLTVTGQISASSIKATTLDTVTETNGMVISGGLLRIEEAVEPYGLNSTTTGFVNFSQTLHYGQYLQYGRFLAYDNVHLDYNTFHVNAELHKVALGTSNTNYMPGKLTVAGYGQENGFAMQHTAVSSENVSFYYQGSSRFTPFIISRNDTGGAEIALFNEGHININGGIGGVTDAQTQKTIDNVGIGVNASAVNNAKPLNKLHVYESLSGVYSNNDYIVTPAPSNAQVRIQATDKDFEPKMSWNQSKQRTLYIAGDSIYANELVIGTSTTGVEKIDGATVSTQLDENPIYFRSRNRLAFKIYDRKAETIGRAFIDGETVSEWATTNYANSGTHLTVTSIETRVETSDSNANDDSGGHLVFRTKPEGGDLTDRVLITDSGNLGIGTGTSTNGKFHVKQGNLNLIVAKSNGLVGFGTANPNERLTVAGNISATGALSANSGVHFGHYTTTERDALSPTKGLVIYNTTDDKFQGYASGSWVDFH